MAFYKNILGTFFSNTINIALSLIGSVFLNRVLGVEGKGEFTVFLATVGLFATFCNFGMDASLKFHVAKSKTQPNQSLFISLLSSILAGTISYLLLYTLSNSSKTLLSDGLNTPYLIGLSSMSVLITICSANLSAILHGYQQFAHLNILLVAQNALSATIYALMFFLKKNGLAIDYHNIILIHLIILSFNLAGVGFIFYRKIDNSNGISFDIKIKSVPLLLRFGFLAFIGNFIQFLNYRIDIWLVESFLGIQSLGLYALAVNLSQMLWVLPKSITSVLMPYVASSAIDNENRTALIGKITFWLCICLAGAGILIAPYLIPLLYGKEFTGSIYAFSVLLIGVAPFSLCMIYASALQGAGKQSINIIASGVGIVVLILIDYLFLNVLGIIGAAIAASSGQFITTFIVIAFYIKEFKKPIYDVLFFNNKDYTLIKSISIKQ